MKNTTIILFILILLSGNIFAQDAISKNDFNLIGFATVDLPKDNLVPANPQNFSVRFTCTYVKLTWLPNENDDPVIIAYNSENKFGTLLNGKEYEEGDIIPGGGVIMYIGSGKHFRHFNPPSDDCYYKIWSFDKNFRYSTGVQATGVDESLINSVIKFITN